MSVIQKIRTKYAKLAGGVIALALVAFILMDALSSRSGNLFGNDTSVAKVNGEEIDYVAYTQRTKDYEVLYGSSQTVTEEFRAQIDQMALEDLIKEKLIEEQAAKLGLLLTEAEKKDMIYGNDPDQMVKNYQAFMDPNTKAFNPQYVKLFEEQADQLDPTGKARLHWVTFKDYIVRNAISKKYNTLFAASVYMPKFLVAAKQKEQAQMADIDYVSIPYEQIKDEEVKLTDDDYKAYMNNHKAEYMIEEDTRSIEYIAFRVLPTAEDTARALGTLNSIKEEFAATTDNESFVNRNSEESYVDKYVMKASYKSMYADSIFNMSAGAVLGPVYENDNYKLMKVLDRKQYPDSVECRHILIQTANQGKEVMADSLAKMKIDSVVAAIKGGASFTDMVAQYSMDEGSKKTGGEYTFGFEQKVTISKEFGDFIFDGAPGETKLVKVENGQYAGYHFIEILSQGASSPALKIATISKALFAGDETENEVYAKATEFAGNSTNAAAFDKNVKDGNLQKLVADNIKVSDYTVYGIGPSREIIRWMYGAKVNDVSPVFAMTGKYIVAKLTSAREKGMMQLDDALKQNMEMQVRNGKKAEMIVKKYESKKSLAEIAAAASSQVQSFDSFRGNNSFSGPMGYAPKVVGYSFSKDFKLNTVSKPIKEQNGVYYISVKNRYGKPDVDTTFVAREREMMQMETKNSISNQVPIQLKKKAKIKYNPTNF